MTSYLISSIVFTFSSVIYCVGAMYALSKDKTVDNIVAFLANLFYVIAYIAYIIECNKENNEEKIRYKPFLRDRSVNHILPI